jgi:hypothetical protein
MVPLLLPKTAISHASYTRHQSAKPKRRSPPRPWASSCLTTDVMGSNGQADHFQKLIIENNYNMGGAVNTRDSVTITYDDEKITYSGFKHSTTGTAVSDFILLEGAVDGRPPEEHFRNFHLGDVGAFSFTRKQSLRPEHGHSAAIKRPRPPMSSTSSPPIPRASPHR